MASVSTVPAAANPSASPSAWTTSPAGAWAWSSACRGAASWSGGVRVPRSPGAQVGVVGADLHGHRGQRHRDRIRIRILQRHGVGDGAGDQLRGTGGQLQQAGGERGGFGTPLGQEPGFGAAAAGPGRDHRRAQQPLQLAGELDDDVGGPQPGRDGRFGGQSRVGAQRGRQLPARRSDLGQPRPRPHQDFAVPGEPLVRGGVLACGGCRLQLDLRGAKHDPSPR
jgi:hypothetical protein